MCYPNFKMLASVMKLPYDNDVICDLCVGGTNRFIRIGSVIHLITMSHNFWQYPYHFQVFAVQHVDVCMFSNGKFKNVVADVNESYQIKAGESYRKEYSLLPLKGNSMDKKSIK